MNLSNSIGGYLELELKKGNLFHAEAIMLNSGRACFEYILRSREITHVYLPTFICDAMFEPLRRLNIPHSFYAIDDKLEIKDDVEVQDNEMLLYVNYFGIKDTYSSFLKDKYGDHLILDCSQAYFFKAEHSDDVFYSPRKFFGVPDGGELITREYLQEKVTQGISYDRMTHLVKRIDLDAEHAYTDFTKNEKTIDESSMQGMSRLTHRLLENIEFESVREQRDKNFRFLHEALGRFNRLVIDVADVSGPLCYPFWTDDLYLRRRLVDNKIFTPTYWPNIMEDSDEMSLEYQLASQIIPLPIDQRYGELEMIKILEVIHAS